MTQLVTRVDDELVTAIDQLIADGAAESRSDAVRQGLQWMADRHRRTRTGEAIAEGYRRLPQADDETGWADQATIDMIAEEPW